MTDPAQLRRDKGDELRREDARKRQRARQRAYRRLAERFPGVFESFMVDEYEAENVTRRASNGH